MAQLLERASSEVSCRLLEVDGAGIEAVLMGYRQRHIDSAQARAYIRLAQLGMHAAVTALAVGKPADFAWPDEKLGAYLQEIKSQYPVDYDRSKRVVHGCVGSYHEVLTPGGWVRLEDLADATPVAQWNQGALSWAVPTVITRTPFKGTSLIKLHGRSISIEMTPDHRVVHAFSGDQKYHTSRADELPTQGRIPNGGVLRGAETYDADLLRLMVAVQADANISNGITVFHFVKPRKIARLRTLLDRLGWYYTDVACACHPTGRRISLGARETSIAAAWLDGKEKRWYLPRLLQLTAECREVILAELPFWDGSIGKTGGYQYFTSVRANAEAVQTLAATCGRQALLREQAPSEHRYGTTPYFTVRFNARAESRIEACERTEVPYVGDVYCVTVPTGFFLIKHDDRISVTGNSNYGLTIYGLTEKFPETFPNLAAAQRQMDYFYLVAPTLPKFQHGVRQQAHKVGYLGGPTMPGTTPSIWDHEYGYRHWFWDVLSYQPTTEWTAKKWALDRTRTDRVVYMHGRPFKVKPGGDWNRTVAFYGQSMGAGWLKEKQNRLFLPWSPDYIGDCYFGRTPLLGPIHDSLLLHIPNRCWDRVVEIVCRVMQEPSTYLPVPADWGFGPYLPIGISAKAGRNWAPQLTEEKIAKIQAKAASEGRDVPHLVPNVTGMEEIEFAQWVLTAGADDPVLPREDADQEDWQALARVVAA